jgi:hypothetical protein
VCSVPVCCDSVNTHRETFFSRVLSFFFDNIPLVTSRVAIFEREWVNLNFISVLLLKRTRERDHEQRTSLPQ